MKEEAIKLFNRHQYDASITTINKAKSLLADPIFLKEAEIFETLATSSVIKKSYEMMLKQELVRKDETLTNKKIQNKRSNRGFRCDYR